MGPEQAAEWWGNGNGNFFGNQGGYDNQQSRGGRWGKQGGNGQGMQGGGKGYGFNNGYGSTSPTGSFGGKGEKNFAPRASTEEKSNSEEADPMLAALLEDGIDEKRREVVLERIA